MLLSIAHKNFNITQLPINLQEDGKEILNVLDGSLDDCREELKVNHWLHEYKKCVHEKLDYFNNYVWELIEEINEEDDDEYFEVSCSCNIRNFIGWILGEIFVVEIFKIFV